MDRGPFWRSSFKTTQRMLEMNLDGFPEDRAGQAIAPGIAAPAWLVGHLVRSRRGILRLLGAPLPEDPAWDPYQRHADGQGAHLPLADLLGAFQATDAPLKAALQAVPDWTQPTLNPALQQEQPLEQVVGFLHTHEAYHVGQLGLMRRLAGLKGAI
ncbi:MAG TPA: DinB family protein [Holophagaceae bacterium]|nr:DinB family protein [Holophagaceae bacterium]